MSQLTAKKTIFKELPLKFEFFFITDRFYQSTWVST